jgi:hypothetical protein
VGRTSRVVEAANAHEAVEKAAKLFDMPAARQNRIFVEKMDEFAYWALSRGGHKASRDKSKLLALGRNRGVAVPTSAAPSFFRAEPRRDDQTLTIGALSGDKPRNSTEEVRITPVPHGQFALPVWWRLDRPHGAALGPT